MEESEPKSQSDQEETASPLDNFLTQPKSVEDGAMEDAHVLEEEILEEQRERLDIAETHVPGHEHR